MTKRLPIQYRWALTTGHCDKKGTKEYHEVKPVVMTKAMIHKIFFRFSAREGANKRGNSSVSIHRNSIDTGKMRRSSLDPTFLLA
ncbi:hypothetical protein ACV1C5_21910, partial [Aeromonas caviae]